jgi:hypothetical protein
MTEEETRESLRRFTEQWTKLIGAKPAELSLVEHNTRPDGTTIAKYEQRPFRFPLRGDYGRLEIIFADRRIIDIKSSCIPDAERIQSVLAGITPSLKPEDAVKFVQQNGVAFTDAAGTRQTFNPASDDVTLRELVVYVEALTAPAHTLEFRVAWEFELKNGPVKNVYVDAVKPSLIPAL